MASFSQLEKKWKKLWRRTGVFEPDLKKAKGPFYNLMMFPYPSAEGLHVGNMYAFVGSDIYGRFQRMKGGDVFEPIGLDGFGIHSENYALKVKKHPAAQAKISEKNFYRQLEMIGNGFAWDEKLETYDPGYYKWTQWIFVQMFKKGLAYRKKQAVNWCPSCKTVLADEQVISGECERCESKVVKKELEQWFFKITKYAEELLSDLDKIDWSEKVKIAQRNWIGKSEGASIKFKLQDSGLKIQDLEVFTTRPDTLFGATFMVVSPELAEKWLNAGWEAPEAVKKYVKKALSKRGAHDHKTEPKKTGVFSGIHAINPANQEKIPIWVSDYVLSGYGTGAVMAVPAHDQRDFELAKKFKLPVRAVIEPVTGEKKENEEFRKSIVAVVENPKTGELLSLNWGKDLGRHLFIGGGVDGDESPEETARREIAEETGYKNVELISFSGRIHHHYVAHSKGVNRFIEAVGFYFKLANEEKTETKLESYEKGKFKIEWVSKRDALDLVKDPLHNLVLRRLVFEEAYEGSGIMTNSGRFNGMDSEKAKWEITKFIGGEKKTQYRLRDWLISRQRYWGPPIPMIFCEKCSWQTVPEKDLPVKLPNIKNFRPTGTDKSPLATVEKFYKTKCPKCNGEARRETDVSDTFLDSAWYFFRYLDHKNKKEIFSKTVAKRWLPVDMYIGGAEHSVLHLLYVRFVTKFFRDIGLVNFDEPFPKFRAHGLLIKDGAKMSKSKGNVVNPDLYIKKFGADALRMYLMFLGPFTEGGDFRDSGIMGITRFLARVGKLKVSGDKITGEIEKLLHRSIKKVGEDIENLRYNTAISQLMILLNKLEESPSVPRDVYGVFLKLLAPFAPFLSEELYQKLQDKKKFSKKDSIHLQSWPEFDPKKITEENFQLVVQINGRVRATILAPSGISENDSKTSAMKDENVRKYLNGKTPRKVIFVPDKLINFVL